jgi:hypothetical protein
MSFRLVDIRRRKIIHVQIMRSKNKGIGVYGSSSTTCCGWTGASLLRRLPSFPCKPRHDLAHALGMPVKKIFWPGYVALVSCVSRQDSRVFPGRVCARSIACQQGEACNVPLLRHPCKSLYRDIIMTARTQPESMVYGLWQDALVPVGEIATLTKPHRSLADVAYSALDIKWQTSQRGNTWQGESRDVVSPTITTKVRSGR